MHTKIIPFLLLILTGCMASVRMPDMVRIPPGTFMMGSPENAGEGDARPVHSVTITRPFFVAVTEVTREDYQLFCRATGRSMPDVRGEDSDQKPVVGVRWDEATQFANWLSEQHGYTPCYTGTRTNISCDFSADGYRLPTEAEWEYAAQYTIPERQGHYGDLTGGGPDEVASLPPDNRGLYDMAGNSFEWCWDWYDPDYYRSSPASDPRGPERPLTVSTPYGPEKVRRSGSWRESLSAVQPQTRSYDSIYYAGDNGFRLVRTAAE